MRRGPGVWRRSRSTASSTSSARASCVAISRRAATARVRSGRCASRASSSGARRVPGSAASSRRGQLVRACSSGMGGRIWAGAAMTLVALVLATGALPGRDDDGGTVSPGRRRRPTRAADRTALCDGRLRASSRLAGLRLVWFTVGRARRPRRLRCPHVRLLRDADRLGDRAARGAAGRATRRRTWAMTRLLESLRGARGAGRAAAVPLLPGGARDGPPRRRGRPRPRGGRRGRRALLGVRPRLARLPGQRRGARPSARAIPARRDHELRHRSLRGVEREARTDLRLGRHRGDGAELQACALPGSSSRSRRSTSRGNGSSTSRRASSTTTCRRSSSG